VQLFRRISSLVNSICQDKMKHTKELAVVIAIVALVAWQARRGRKGYLVRWWDYTCMSCGRRLQYEPLGPTKGPYGTGIKGGEYVCSNGCKVIWGKG
jgi:hypothetical protein